MWFCYLLFDDKQLMAGPHVDPLTRLSAIRLTSLTQNTAVPQGARATLRGPNLVARDLDFDKRSRQWVGQAVGHGQLPVRTACDGMRRHVTSLLL